MWKSLDTASIIYMNVMSENCSLIDIESEVARSCPTLCDPVDGSLPICAWGSPGKNTAVGCHALLQGILPTQGSNLLSLRSPALAGGFLTTRATREASPSFLGVINVGAPSLDSTHSKFLCLEA